MTIKQFSVIGLLIVSFTKIVCADTSLHIKPEMIETFKDANIFAMDDAGKYQIGLLGGKWLQAHDIQGLGLSLLAHTASTDAGIYLIGSEKQLDSDKSAFYTGLIVLINSSNTIVNKWHHTSNFLHVSQHNEQLTLTSYDGVYTLNAGDGIRSLMTNERRKHWTSIRLVDGSLILCNPNSTSKSTSGVYALYGEVGCGKGDSWFFKGAWFPSTENYTTDPFICGSWLIESVQEKYKSPITGIIVRAFTHVNGVDDTQNPKSLL